MAVHLPQFNLSSIAPGQASPIALPRAVSLTPDGYSNVTTALLGVFLVVSLYLLPKATSGKVPGLFTRKLRDKAGNTTPAGPVGLPIVGEMFSVVDMQV